MNAELPKAAIDIDTGKGAGIQSGRSLCGGCSGCGGCGGGFRGGGFRGGCLRATGSVGKAPG